MGPGHQAMAAVFTAAVGQGVAVAQIKTGQPELGPDVNLVNIGVAVVLAMAFSAGPLSPDADQSWLSWLPHRGPTHNAWIPIVVVAALAVMDAPFWAWGPALGYWSHIWPADYLFGKAAVRQGRGPGVKFLGKWRGRGWKVDGKWEHRWTKALPVVFILQGVLQLAIVGHSAV